MNPTALRERAGILAAIRQWFSDNGYLEVQTPVLVPVGAMEPHLEPVGVGSMQLHTSPEFAMKRVLSEGLLRIYQIVPCFREEEEGVHHSREFTMLEWYRAGAGTRELMDDVEELIGVAANSVNRTVPIFERVPVDALIEEAQGMVSVSDRQAIYRRIYQIVRDDAPWIFLYNPTLYWGVAEGVEWMPRVDGLMVFR